ncbi:SETMR methyltransferase, partial [Acromyrmex insinuator]
FREFRGGRNSTTDEIRSGRLSDAVTEENVKKIHEMVLADRKVKVRELADVTKISTERTRHILGEILHMKKLSCRWVPRMLTPDQKEHFERVDLLMRNRADFWRRLVTVDETWIHYYTPENRMSARQWTEAGTSAPKRPREARWLARWKNYNNMISRLIIVKVSHKNADGFSRWPCASDQCRYCANVELRPSWQEVTANDVSIKVYWSYWDTLEIKHFDINKTLDKVWRHNVGAPFERVLRLLSITSAGRYLLIAVDFFTKWVECSKHGVPLEVDIDQERNREFLRTVMNPARHKKSIDRSRRASISPSSLARRSSRITCLALIARRSTDRPSVAASRSHSQHPRDAVASYQTPPLELNVSRMGSRSKRLSPDSI